MAISPGLELLKHEMARQHADALASFHANRAPARAAADAILRHKRLLLLGMGASHWLNRTVLGLYRGLGVDASAEVLSDYMRAPLPAGRRATLITSQSGASGEIAAYFDRFAQLDDHFGLTLNGCSRLGRGVPCLVGEGGPEEAFAATRSIMITLALHGGVLDALGCDVSELLELLAAGPMLEDTPDEAAVALLSGCDALFLASRGLEQGICESAALTFMELARVPALALELGQLIHGPFEALSAKTALLLVRPAGSDAASVTRFAETAVAAGIRPLLFDIGEHPPVREAVACRLPTQEGLASAAQLLPALQRLLIEAAARRVPDMGKPLRSSKVTDGEVS